MTFEFLQNLYEVETEMFTEGKIKFLTFHKSLETVRINFNRFIINFKLNFFKIYLLFLLTEINDCTQILS